MGVGTFFHYFGTVLLLAATALLIVVSVTAPVVNDLSLLKINFSGSSSVDRITFGTFGYCIQNAKYVLVHLLITLKHYHMRNTIANIYKADTMHAPTLTSATRAPTP
jgi:hypothetical protein